MKAKNNNVYHIFFVACGIVIITLASTNILVDLNQETTTSTTNFVTRQTTSDTNPMIEHITRQLIDRPTISYVGLHRRCPTHWDYHPLLQWNQTNDTNDTSKKIDVLHVVEPHRDWYEDYQVDNIQPLYIWLEKGQHATELTINKSTQKVQYKVQFAIDGEILFQRV